MSIKLVTYDISDADNRAKCLAEIKKYNYIEVAESDYLVDTSDTTKEIRIKLASYFESSDLLFICKVHKGQWAQLHHTQRKIDWIEANAT